MEGALGTRWMVVERWLGSIHWFKTVQKNRQRQRVAALGPPCIVIAALSTEESKQKNSHLRKNKPSLDVGYGRISDSFITQTAAHLARVPEDHQGDHSIQHLLHCGLALVALALLCSALLDAEDGAAGAQPVRVQKLEPGRARRRNSKKGTKKEECY